MDFSIFEGLFDGALVIDEGFRIVYANRSAKEIFGEKLEGKECRGLFSICKSCPFEYVKEDGEGVQVYDITLKTSKHVCWSTGCFKNSL
ncbi:MAG: PAS domain-containing protein [Aquificaceae bacterium]